MRKQTKIGAGAVALAVGTTMAVGQVTTFVVLPAPSGMNFVTPTGISGDGSTVVGTAVATTDFAVRAYRWTRTGGPQQLGTAPGTSDSRGYAASFNGASIFGESGNAGFEWNAPGPMAALPGTAVLDVGTDGTVRLTRTAATNGGGESVLPPLPGDQSVEATGISSDGTYVAMTSHFFQSGGSGYGYGGGGPDILRDQACRWTYTVGVEACGFLPGTTRSFATSISENGAVVIGYACTSNGSICKWFRWTSGTGIQPMLGIGGQNEPLDSAPSDCSADGSVVVGTRNGEAVVWTQAQGYRSLKQILVTNGWDVAGWTFVEIAGVSDDGRVVTGRALDQFGDLRAFVTPLDVACVGPSVPWFPTSRVIVAEGDALPGGRVASGVSAITVNGQGASLFTSSGGAWFSPVGGGVPTLLAEVAGPVTGIERPGLNDSGLVALTKLSTIFIEGEPVTARTVAAGQVGALANIAVHGQAVPAASGGGTLSTIFGVDGPFVSGGNLVTFQSRVTGGTLGTAQTLVYDAVAGGGLVRSSPSASATNPVTVAVSDNGSILRTAQQGLYVGGPPPIFNTLVAPIGGAAPGITGGTFSAVARPVVNGNGAVAFLASVSTPSGSVPALYRAPAGGAPQLVATEGTNAGPGGALVDFQNVMIAENGSVYFIARQGVDASTVVVKARGDGSFVIVAKDKDPLPGSGPCRELNDWELIGIDGRRVFLYARMSGPSSTGQTLLAWGEGEPLAVLARTGDIATPRPGLTGTVAALGAGAGGSGHDGRNTNFKGNRAVYTLFLDQSAQGGSASVPVVVESTLPPLACGVGDLGSAGGMVGADGVLDNNDFIAFITLFFAADTRADLGVSGGLPGSDGVFNNNDFIAFIGRFFAGCQ